MISVNNSELHARLLPTPLVASFVGRARPGELDDPDASKRAAAWASWAINSLSEFKGISDREYVGLILPGKFHDPRGTGPVIRPHLEIPSRVLDQPDIDFPDRLSQAGNGIRFPWWIVSEVTALRRALFISPPGSPKPLIDALNNRHHGLVTALAKLSADLEPSWSQIESLLLTSSDGLVPDVCGDFSTEEIARIFPPAIELNLTVRFDPKLKENSGLWASRRVGVWQINGNTKTERFAIGVVTPRLTTNSLFKDPLFTPSNESPAAILVRLLILHRLASRHLTDKKPYANPVGLDPSASGIGLPHLRAVPARVGQKLPEASVEAAVHFLQNFPDAEQAWTMLVRWAGETNLLTITQEAFRSAHANALRYIRRAETPDRDDINVLLPLAWNNGKVLRVTFSRPSE